MTANGGFLGELGGMKLMRIKSKPGNLSVMPSPQLFGRGVVLVVALFLLALWNLEPAKAQNTPSNYPERSGSNSQVAPGSSNPGNPSISGTNPQGNPPAVSPTPFPPINAEPGMTPYPRGTP